MKRLLRATFLSLACFPLWAQPTAIELKNPSFEDIPGAGWVPYGWTPCGFPDETPPDTNPCEVYQVKMPAYYGKTYLGMVVRDNDTWEGVTQPLVQPLLAGQCYGFTFFAACSKHYESMSRKTGTMINYKRPAKLRIWAGYDFCESLQLLAETDAIEHHEWRAYTLFLKPNAPYTHLFLEAHFLNPNDKPYCGNILLDNLSNLSPVNCPDSFLVVKQPVWDGSKLPSKPDTVYFLKPEDFDQLKSLVSNYSRKIQFEPDNRLERQLYYVAHEKGGLRFFQNQHLHYLVAIVKEMPKMKLTVSVSDDNEAALSEKIESIRELLAFMDVPPARIKVIPFSKADPKEHWVGKRDGVLLSVERK